MSTVPVPAGDVAVMRVELVTRNRAAAVEPNVTAVDPVKWEPLTVTVVPPLVGPVLGATEVTVGAGAAGVGTDGEDVEDVEVGDDVPA